MYQINMQVKSMLQLQFLKMIDRYKVFTEDEIKTLVVDDKWMAAIGGDVKSEMERISQRLARRIKELAKRYDSPMPAMNAKVDELEMKVNGHLEKMGFDF